MAQYVGACAVTAFGGLLPEDATNWADDYLRKTHGLFSEILNDPYLIVEAMAQEASDAIDEKGLEYGAGYLGGLAVEYFIGDKGVSKAAKGNKTVGATQKVVSKLDDIKGPALSTEAAAKLTSVESLVKMGVKGADELAKKGISSIDDLVRVGINSADDLERLGLASADELKKLGITDVHKLVDKGIVSDSDLAKLGLKSGTNLADEVARYKNINIKEVTPSGSQNPVKVYTDGYAQVNKGKIDTYIRGKIKKPENYSELKARIEELTKLKDTRPSEFTKEMNNELKDINKKVHNYERSKGMGDLLNKAGIADTVENNEMIANTVLDAAKEVKAGNTKITRYIKGTNKEVIVESWWIIDGDGTPYCSTIILKEVK